MKQFFIYTLLLLIWACDPSANGSENKTELTPVVEENLAAKWGADEYGMKPYVMAFLKSGPTRDQDSLTAANIQKAHLENIQRMSEEGSLVIAGPFLDDGEVRGIYIFNVETIEEARDLTQTDPAVQSGRLVMELHPWYGSAALMGIRDMHKKLSAKDPSDS